MLLYVAVVGDSSTHGGTVIGGDPTFTILGKPVAVIGMSVHSCPVDKHGTTSIIPGSSLLNRPTINGKPVVLDGDLTGCGARIIATTPYAAVIS
jgi:uncharacterized Zn-binding protein involved in type VI secretion